MNAPKHIALLGETALVNEYASLCLNRNMEVHARFNPDEDRATGRTRQSFRRADIALELTNISPDRKRKNLIALDKSLKVTVPLLSSSVTVSVAEQATWIAHPERLIGIAALPGLLDGRLMELALSATTAQPAAAGASGFARALGKETEIVQDVVGLVMPRILCMLVNEACFAMMEGVAGRRDIDTAMTLGVNYPFGPVAWAERIGVRQVHAVIAALHRNFGEDRYRVAPLLQSAALQGSFLQIRDFSVSYFP
jgi:3-hydroxybutyryl-CoA dehydrogenase